MDRRMNDSFEVEVEVEVEQFRISAIWLQDEVNVGIDETACHTKLTKLNAHTVPRRENVIATPYDMASVGNSTLLANHLLVFL
jgi:hypothetical protein